MNSTARLRAGIERCGPPELPEREPDGAPAEGCGRGKVARRAAAAVRFCLTQMSATDVCHIDIYKRSVMIRAVGAACAVAMDSLV